MSTGTRFARTMIRSMVCLAALTLVAGTGCDEEGMGGVLGILSDVSAFATEGGYYPDGFGGNGGGDYYYGFTETDGNGISRSFSLTPGIDAGESLETYLGSSVVY